jgi:hypothetical protein
MRIRAAALVMLAGCFSAAGGGAINVSVGDGPVRRASGHIQLGTFTEIVEDRAVGSLFYNRDFGPLGVHAWGAQILTMNSGLRPGLYLVGAYGQKDDALRRQASTVIAGAGIAYGQMRPGTRGRGFTGASLGLVFHRERQEMAGAPLIGEFFGLELTIHAAFDLIGPMFATSTE